MKYKTKVNFVPNEDKEGFIWLVGYADLPETIQIYEKVKDANHYYKGLGSRLAKYFIQLEIIR